MNTTLNEIISRKPNPNRWEQLLEALGKTEADDEPLSYVKILELNGLSDAHWSLRCIEPEHDFIVRLYAARVAESTLCHYEAVYPEDKRVSECIHVVRRYALGEASIDELDAAGSAAGNAAESALAAGIAAWCAAWNATWSARWAAGSAVRCATCSDAELQKEKAWFREYFTQARSLDYYRETEGSNA